MRGASKCFLIVPPFSAIIRAEFEVDIASPNGNALRGWSPWRAFLRSWSDRAQLVATLAAASTAPASARLAYRGCSPER